MTATDEDDARERLRTSSDFFLSFFHVLLIVAFAFVLIFVCIQFFVLILCTYIRLTYYVNAM